MAFGAKELEARLEREVEEEEERRSIGGTREPRRVVGESVLEPTMMLRKVSEPKREAEEGKGREGGKGQLELESPSLCLASVSAPFCFDSPLGSIRQLEASRNGLLHDVLFSNAGRCEL